MSVSYIIVTRNPRSKKLIVIVDDDGGPCEYPTEQTALYDARRINMCKAWGAEIVPIGGVEPV